MGGSSRRSFLGHTAVLGSAAVVGGAAVPAQAKDQQRKQVVPTELRRPFSRATMFGGLVYPAGVVGRDPKTGAMVTGGFEAECRQALANMKASVEAAGTTMENVLKCTCFLTDVSDFATFNKVFGESFPTNPPARSTVIVKALVVAGARMEIDCVACRLR